jgi:hypothetical protein
MPDRHIATRQRTRIAAFHLTPPPHRRTAKQIIEIQQIQSTYLTYFAKYAILAERVVARRNVPIDVEARIDHGDAFNDSREILLKSL